MAQRFNRNIPAQLYLSIIPAGIAGALAVHGYRRDNAISKFYTWRSTEQAPDSVIENFETEFTNLVTKARKVYRNVDFHVSMINNLEARTYGSFGLNQGAEFQVPLLSAVESVKDLKEKYPDLLTVVKELGIKGGVDTSSIPDNVLQPVLLTDAARYFFLRREILQAESFSHMVVPIVLGSVSFALGYPIFSLITRAAGPAIGLGLVVPFALYFTYQILKIEATQRVLAMDNRVLEEDASLLAGAKQYLQARIAFGKLLHKIGGDATKAFDEKGDCSHLNAPYTARLKQVLDLEEKQKQSTAVNVRTL
uniref:Transmembrane protein n=1 Tax=Panagrellus redivivus TaxID=6233 RepID=A0A7E4VQZ0_PANRE